MNAVHDIIINMRRRVVKPAAGQIYTLDLSESDSVVYYDQESTGGSLLDTVRDMIDGALSYFR